jgi:hypothetical protein
MNCHFCYRQQRQKKLLEQWVFNGGAYEILGFTSWREASKVRDFGIDAAPRDINNVTCLSHRAHLRFEVEAN